MEAEQQRVKAKQLAKRQRMEQMFQWMQGLGERMGLPMAPMLFPPPPPPAVTSKSMNDFNCMFSP